MLRQFSFLLLLVVFSSIDGNKHDYFGDQKPFEMLFAESEEDGNEPTWANFSKTSTSLPTTTPSSSSTTATTTLANCILPDISHFPKNMFNKSQRLHGAIILNILVALYMFVGMAIVCDGYFVPALSELCRTLKLKEDVAGATFMAAGSSVLDLATTIISLFVAKDVDIGIGTVNGSSVFNLMFVMGLVAIFIKMDLHLKPYPIVRDAIFYIISILILLLIIADEKVYWYEATLLIVFYAIFIIVIICNDHLEIFFYNLFNNEAVRTIDYLVDSFTYHITIKNDKQQQQQQQQTVVEVTSEQQDSNYDFDDDDDLISAIYATSQRHVVESETSDNKLNPFRFPSRDESLLTRAKFIALWPILVLLFITIPNCRHDYWKKFFLVSFGMSLVWLAFLSYVMVWMITIIGYTLSIPDTIMGITLISFGASLPDLFSSLIIARKGLCNMALSNALGSCIFGILLCLGLPWFVLSVSSGSFIQVQSKGLVYSSVSLIGTVIILLVSIKLAKWKLNKSLGVTLLASYVGYMVLASLYELNLVGVNHLPMCTDDNY